MSNEVKVALLAIAAFALFYWGYKFVRGKNVLANSNLYYVEYDNVDQLKISEPVLINGFEVGFVADIYLKPKDYSKIVVKLDLRKDISIPKDTRATIISTGFMGGKAIVLDYPQPCSGSNCAPSGSYLKGRTLGLLGSMVGEETIQDYMKVLKDNLGDVIDTLNRKLLSEDAKGPLAESMRNLSATLLNLRETTGRLNALMASGNIDGTMKNLRGITDNLQASNQKIDSIITNADRITSQIASADLEQTLKNVDEAIANLKTTLDSADEALSGVSNAVGKINAGEGTLGKLLQDEELYNKLNQLSLQTDSLIEDFQERPYRYMPFKSRNKVKKFDRQDAAEAARIKGEPAGSQ